MRTCRRAVLFTATAACFAALLGFSSSALAAPHGRYGAAATPPRVVARSEHRFEGIVPSARAGGKEHGRPTKHEFAGTALSSSNNLKYWGGPVMSTNTTYTIYWPGTGNYGAGFSSGYQSIINGFFSNLAAAQNATNNVYAVGTQYYGPSGSSIFNRSSVGGSAVDSTSPIPDDCSAEYAGTGITVSGCITDADLQAEVSRAIAANGWQPGPNAMFFVFTPQNVGSCFDSSSGQCAYSYYCAYHSQFTDSSGNDVIYADMPYSQTAGVGAPGVCDSGEYPNGNAAADDTINLVSHEHNEAITDPNGNAWYDSSGNENGDKCAWNFGASAGAPGSEYNQQIGGGFYYLQQEWSNASSGCALSYSPPAPASVTVSGFSPTQAKTGTTVTINGTGFASGSTVSFTGLSGSVASPSVTFVSSTQLRATVPAAAANGPITVSLPSGSSASSSSRFLVLPNITGFSPSSGPVGTTVTINGSGFGGTSSVAFGGTLATYTVVSANQLRATVPSRAKSGHITVRTSTGSASSATNFTVTAH